MAEQGQRREVKYNGGTLRPFNKGESGNPKGGKKSEITRIREEFELKYNWKISKADAEQLLQLLVFAPISELKELAKNPNLPAVVVNYIHAIFSDIRKGEIKAAKEIIEFNFGKATQKLELEDKTPQHIDLSTLSQEQLLSATKHLSGMLEIKMLEEFREWIDNLDQKKRSNEAKIING